MISVATPSYNRAKELKRLYASLQRQTYKDFEWIIIDDGSTDDTEEVVKSFKKNKDMQIVYVKTKNQGKLEARNESVKIAKGSLYVGIDSDDYFLDNALEISNDYYEKIKDDESIAGTTFLNLNMDNDQVIGTLFPEDEMIDTYINIYKKYKVTGDKQFNIKTDIAKKYLTPKFGNERFLPEAILFVRMSHNYKFMYVNKPVIYKEYTSGGITKNYFNIVKKNPIGNMTYYKELYDFEKTDYNIACYLLFGIYAKFSLKTLMKNHQAKIRCVLFYLPVKIISIVKR